MHEILGRPPAGRLRFRAPSRLGRMGRTAGWLSAPSAQPKQPAFPCGPCGPQAGRRDSSTARPQRKALASVRLRRSCSDRLSLAVLRVVRLEGLLVDAREDALVDGGEEVPAEVEGVLD